MTLSTEELVSAAAEIADDAKARDLIVLDLRGISPVTDFFIICSGTSDTHVQAISDAVLEGLKKQGHRPFGVEGYREGRWVLMDYVNVVLHVFHSEQRVFFGLEELWHDAKRFAPSRAPAEAGG